MPQSIKVINTIPINVKSFITVRKKFDKISFQQVILETQIDKIIDKQLSIYLVGKCKEFCWLEVY